MNILFKAFILTCPSGSTEIYCSSFTTGNQKALLLIRHMCLPIKNHWMFRKNSETGSYTQANSQRMRRCLFQVSDGMRRLFVLRKCGDHMNYLSPIYHLCLSPAPELGVGNGVWLTECQSLGNKESWRKSWSVCLNVHDLWTAVSKQLHENRSVKMSSTLPYSACRARHICLST